MLPNNQFKVESTLQINSQNNNSFWKILMLKALTIKTLFTTIVPIQKVTRLEQVKTLKGRPN